MKKLLLIFTAAMAVFALSACDDDKRERDDDRNPTEEIELTLEELAMYDGQEGNDAYIVVDGVIYDVTNVEEWEGGCHNGVCAGTDASEVIGNSPHGKAVLDDLDVIGTLVESTDDVPVDETLYLTIEELAMYDGSNGTDAYVAVDGIIYDVTMNDAFEGGCHQGLCAGNDLTVEIGNSPHGESVLSGLDAVGELVIDNTGDMPYDAYMYLTLTELAMYDGLHGNDAYVAVNDVLYDVTNVDAWAGGCHNGVCAGTDATTAITNAPHGESVLANLVIVGELIPE